jgi:hypothetical protein
VTDITRAHRALAKRRTWCINQMLAWRAPADIAVELAAEPDLELLGLEGIEDALWGMLDGLLMLWVAEYAHNSAMLRGGPVVAGPTWTGGVEGARMSIERALAKCGQRYEDLTALAHRRIYASWVAAYEDAMACWGLDAE